MIKSVRQSAAFGFLSHIGPATGYWFTKNHSLQMSLESVSLSTTHTCETVAHLRKVDRKTHKTNTDRHQRPCDDWCSDASRLKHFSIRTCVHHHTCQIYRADSMFLLWAHIVAVYVCEVTVIAVTRSIVVCVYVRSDRNCEWSCLFSRTQTHERIFTISTYVRSSYSCCGRVRRAHRLRVPVSYVYLSECECQCVRNIISFYLRFVIYVRACALATRKNTFCTKSRLTIRDP